MNPPSLDADGLRRMAPPVHTNPASQVVHTSGVLPLVYVPAGQAEHADATDVRDVAFTSGGANLPAGQLTAKVDPGTQNVPSGHTKGDEVPGGHA